MLLVSDAEVFVDFAVAGLTAELFRLPHGILVSDILYERAIVDRHARLRELGLQVRTLTGAQVNDAYRLRRKHPDLSVEDLCALALARSLACPIVTRDRRLRRAARGEGLRSLDTLALMEQMSLHSLVSLNRIRRACARMSAAGRRLARERRMESRGRVRADGHRDDRCSSRI